MVLKFLNEAFKILGSGKERVFRGCQLNGGKTDICAAVRLKAEKKNIQVVQCLTCEEDGCNKSPLNHVNIWLILVPVLFMKTLA